MNIDKMQMIILTTITIAVFNITNSGDFNLWLTLYIFW